MAVDIPVPQCRRYNYYGGTSLLHILDTLIETFYNLVFIHIKPKIFGGVHIGVKFGSIHESSYITDIYPIIGIGRYTIPHDNIGEIEPLSFRTNEYSGCEAI